MLWTHIEEPSPTEPVTDKSGERVWFLASTRDASGAVTLSVGEKQAMQLAGVASPQELKDKHAAGCMNFPLFVNLRVARKTKSALDGGTSIMRVDSSSASQDSGKKYVSYRIVDMEPVDWARTKM